MLNCVMVRGGRWLMVGGERWVVAGGGRWVVAGGGRGAALAVEAETRRKNICLSSDGKGYGR